MKKETIGQGIPKAEILKLAAGRQERLDRLLRRHSDDRTSGQAKTKKKGGATANLARILEEEYAKKKDIDARKQ